MYFMYCTVYMICNKDEEGRKYTKDNLQYVTVVGGHVSQLYKTSEKTSSTLMTN